jgi:hypothetical protein
MSDANGPFVTQWLREQKVLTARSLVFFFNMLAVRRYRAKIRISRLNVSEAGHD